MSTIKELVNIYAIAHILETPGRFTNGRIVEVLKQTPGFYESLKPINRKDDKLSLVSKERKETWERAVRATFAQTDENIRFMQSIGITFDPTDRSWSSK